MTCLSERLPLNDLHIERELTATSLSLFESRDKMMMQLKIISLLAAAALLPKEAVGCHLKASPPGLQAAGIGANDGQDDWPINVESGSPWGARIETDDKLIGWSDRQKRNFELRWNNQLDDFSDFICDHIGEKIYLLVENHRNDEALIVRVKATDHDDWC